MKIGIVDYNAGNLTSVVSAISHIGADYLVSSDHDQLMRCDKLLFPGVGEAKWAMKQLESKGLESTLFDFKKPIFSCMKISYQNKMLHERLVNFELIK